ncbi:lysine N6-hydroxylase [Sinobacterium caligoides]|uniref:Lysine N6-hydroxylase n=1 Tax=Sinobacterium caligoides TaxID=933926 RepID=A0A3N2DKD8_9GAMM|nr:SidA/IucD/PvdA family monooxygenase [Sinobacterium caligoides]ROS00238.1 lysine N6-hydroxylase [Sinobacterium caligoides]
MSPVIYDFVAIGLGPFNLSLACLSSPIEGLNGLFLEQKEEFNWHPGLMFESAHLQTPFMSDLVTLADPTHPLSFLNYIKKQGRLYSFYIREDFYIMRREYNQYCRWAANELDNIAFGQCVTEVTRSEKTDCYRLVVRNTKDNSERIVYSRKLVLGTGPSPYRPDCCPDSDKRICHASDYLYQKEQLQQQSSITLVGSGQSAAEIYYDLLGDIDQYGYELNWITRAPRFFPLEYTKLTLEMTSPEYVDYFYALPQQKKDELINRQKQLYKGINGDLINEIFDLLYVKRLQHNFTSNILTNSTLQGVDNPDNTAQPLTLRFMQNEQQQAYELNSQRMILATGYQYQMPDFIAGISQQIRWDDHGRFDVQRNYSIDQKGGEIFVQNAELHSHGFVTPDLGMACYRNSYILREILGYAPYEVEERIAFQQFTAPTKTGGNIRAVEPIPLRQESASTCR